MRFKYLIFLFLISTPWLQSSPLQSKILQITKKSDVLSELSENDQQELAKLFEEQGHEYKKQNKWVLSVIYYRKSLALNPSNIQLLLFSGMNYSKLKRYDKAEDFFLKYKSHSQQNSWTKICDQYLFDILNAKADQLSKTSLWDRAIESYQNSLQYSDSAEKTSNTLSKIHYSYFQKGSFHFSQKHFLEASKSLRFALTPETSGVLVRKIERMAAHLFLNSAKHYEKESNYKEAKEYYQSISKYFSSPSATSYANKRLEAIEKMNLESSQEESLWISN